MKTFEIIMELDKDIIGKKGDIITVYSVDEIDDLPMNEDEKRACRQFYDFVQDTLVPMGMGNIVGYTIVDADTYVLPVKEDWVMEVLQ